MLADEIKIKKYIKMWSYTILYYISVVSFVLFLNLRETSLFVNFGSLILLALLFIYFFIKSQRTYREVTHE